MTLSQTPESDEKKDRLLPPHSPLLSPRDPRASRSPSELVPPLFRPKFRPCSRLVLKAAIQSSFSLFPPPVMGEARDIATTSSIRTYIHMNFISLNNW